MTERIDGVTLVSGALLLPGCAAAYAEAHHAGVAAARRLGGLVNADLVPAIRGVQDDTVALMTFESREDLDRWLASPAREATMRAMSEFTSGDRRINVVSGFPGWFPDASPAAPAKWRQALLVVAGLIPVALIVTLARDALLPRLPVVAAVALTSTLNVVALTWMVMPRMNTWFSTWLYRRGR